VNGITQSSSARGITQSSALGITQSSAADGITQSSLVDGITQSSAFGITQSSVVDGITQSSSVDGITQSSTLGITQSSFADGITQSSVLSGPIDSIDATNGVFEAVGQTIMASQEMLSGLVVGDYVSVDGSVVAPGWLYADTLSVSTDTYIPGVHEIYLEGMPNSVDASVGQMKVGNLLIDFNAVLSNGPIPTGHSFSFRGIQPVSQGVLLTDSVQVVQ
jgi:hypothetical protein